MVNLELMARMEMLGHKACKAYLDQWVVLEIRAQLGNRVQKEILEYPETLDQGETQARMDLTGLLDRQDNLVLLVTEERLGHQVPGDFKACLEQQEKLAKREKMEKPDYLVNLD